MRIVIDLQAAQSSGSRNRGIGRYSLSLAQAMVRQRGEHEVLIALNGMFADSVEPIRAAFEGLLPQKNILVWEAFAPVAHASKSNDWRRKVAEALREEFLASLEPDFVHVSSLFEGLGDDAVTSIGTSCKLPTAVTLYDLIPYIHQTPYLMDAGVRAWYFEKIEQLLRADLWLAISESSRREGVEFLELSEVSAVNISTDADAHFKPVEISLDAERELRGKYGLDKPFVMYTGGIDHRKNIEGLIRAFSCLPADVCASHQLAIVCSVQPASREALEKLAAESGLTRNEVVLTGFVPDEDLLALYNLCTLFIFPSWHEGFGLPALEAMRCGAPVIGANTSSIPEVIGWDEALFDPHSDDAIARAIERALTDQAYRTELIARAQAQAQRFSWEESARRAIGAMERAHAARSASVEPRPDTAGRQGKPALAFVSPLPPERSGIADYSAELLPSLARHYDIDVISDLPSVEDPWIQANCSVRSVQWFLEHSLRYERVLYHFGNSAFHQRMFEMLRAVPGVVVLHDFYLSGVLAHMQWAAPGGSDFSGAMLRSHGFAGVRAYMGAEDKSEIVWNYPCSLEVIQDALGVIVHSANSRGLASQWYGIPAQNWAVIPLLRNPHMHYERSEARAALGIGQDDFLVCAFGILGPHKLNHQLLQAWAGSELARNETCRLVFVGQNDGGEYGEEVLAAIRRSRKGTIRITGWTDSDTFRRYLAAADVGVQLRTLSRGETSRAVLDCMNYGLATIVNANGSMADLPSDAVLMLPDAFTDEELSAALETLWHDRAARHALGRAGREAILRTHDPEACGDAYAQAIERFYLPRHAASLRLVRSMAKLARDGVGARDMEGVSKAIAASFPPANSKRQLLLDVSELVLRDSRSGIQRVVRSLLRNLLLSPPEGVCVEPVYATPDTVGYRYARTFTYRFLGCGDTQVFDDPVDFAPGDVFLGLDLSLDVVPTQADFYQRLRGHGATVKFIVYDLLPALMAHTCAQGVSEQYRKWLDVVAASDGAVCISEAVAGELSAWLEDEHRNRKLPFSIDWFHLGADIENSQPSSGLPENASEVLQALRAGPSFLAVGTLEPRKAQGQVLDAFELLWRDGIEANLVVVGKEGWRVGQLAARLRNHPRNGERLFWLDGISDEYLEKVYRAATCLIAASEGEGFGLPLIEAAQRSLPIVARDIPVFREVAGEHAFYFSGKEPRALADSLCAWLALHARDEHPKSSGLPWLTWEQSAHALLESLSLGTGAAR